MKIESYLFPSYSTAFLLPENLLVAGRRFRSGRPKTLVKWQRPAHYEKALFQAVTKPVYPYISAVDRCQREQREKQLETLNPARPHEFAQIQANELYRWFDESNTILLCHMNSMKAMEYFNFRVACHKKDITTKIYSRSVIKLALENTGFESMLPVLVATEHSCMLFSNERNVGEVLKITKRIPKVVLLCGAIDNRFMSRNELEHYASLPDKTTVQAQFVATLNSIGGQLVSNLQAHQSNLCYMLDARADALKTPTTNTDADAAKS